MSEATASSLGDSQTPQRDATRAVSEASRLTKNQRQGRITELLEHHDVTSQAELVDLLAEVGVIATQTTVSRDLDELGAIKVRVRNANSIYAIPEKSWDRPAPEDHLRRVLSDWLVSIVCSFNVVVLRTPPGCAHVVGSALDRSGLPGILGTVAGDDTLMVVASEEVGGSALAARLASLADLEVGA